MKAGPIKGLPIMEHGRASTWGSGSSAEGGSIGRIQVSKNTRRLQLRNNNIRAASFSNDHRVEALSNPKIRNRGRATSSGSSTSSTFDEDLTSHSQSTLQNENSPPKTPPLESDPYWATSDPKKRNFMSDDHSARISSMFSDTSTLVDGQIEGFGNLSELEGNSVVGFRFYDSNSGSDRPFASYGRKREVSNGSNTSDGSSGRRGSGRKRATGAKNGYTTPPKRGSLGRRHTDRDAGFFSHPDDNARHLEYVEQQLKELTEKYNEITSPTSTASYVARLKKLTAENKALRLEVEEYHTIFEEKVKEKARQKIIENEMETRARVAAAEERIRQNEETIKRLQGEMEKWKSDFYELAEAAYEERQKYEQHTQAYETQIESLKHMLENHIEQPVDRDSRPKSRDRSRPSLFDNAQSLMEELGICQGSDTSSRRGSLCSRSSGRAPGRLRSDTSEALTAFIDSDEDALLETPLRRYSKSYRLSSPAASDPGEGEQSRRRMRKFNGGTVAPMPLILPTALGIGSSAQSPTEPKVEIRAPTPADDGGINGGSSDTHSRPVSRNSFYCAGVDANESTTSIDSSVHSMPSVPRSVKGNPLTDSLFAEFHRLEDDEVQDHERLSVPEDSSAYSRAQSPISTYSTTFGFAGGLSNTRTRVSRKACSAPSASRKVSTGSMNPSPPARTARAVSASHIVGSMFPSPQVSLFTAFKNNRLGNVIVSSLSAPAFVFQAAKRRAVNAVSAVLREAILERPLKRGRKEREREDYICTCGAKNGKSTRRSASAPTSGRLVDIGLFSETTGGQLLRQNGAQDSASRRLRRRRNSNAWQNSDHPKYIRVPRQRQVHAGDNVWTWVKFVFTLIVALGVACKEGSLRDVDVERASEHLIIEDYGLDYSSTDSEDMEDDQISADEDSLEGKVERWRRQWSSSALIGGV